ncbi:hypothetical protein P3W53_00910 [Pseudomonas denitrificans (nom. rej.)]|nr:hypothetical protein [Pseudomonas denitrificans (nom. rej.)]
MESMQDRAVALIYKTGLDDLVRQSSISYSRWKNLRHKRVRLSTEEVEVLVKIYPQYALWVASGQIAPESGQTSPDYDAVNQNISNQHAG